MLDKEQEIQQLIAKNAALEAQIAKLNAERATLEDALSSLRAQIAWLRQKVFGSSMSEKHLPLDPNVLEPTLFDAVLPEEEQAKLDAEVKAMEDQNAKAIEVKAHRREVRRPVLSSNLPVREHHSYPEGMEGNPDYVEIGTEVTDRLAIIPGQLYIDRTVRHKFVLKSSLQIEDPDRQAFVIAPAPESVIPRGMAADSLLADIFIGKYVYHLPFYRQIQK